VEGRTDIAGVRHLRAIEEDRASFQPVRHRRCLSTSRPPRRSASTCRRHCSPAPRM
jgi:hypothetical protein